MVPEPGAEKWHVRGRRVSKRIWTFVGFDVTSILPAQFGPLSCSAGFVPQTRRSCEPWAPRSDTPGQASKLPFVASQEPVRMKPSTSSRRRVPDGRSAADRREEDGQRERLA